MTDEVITGQEETDESTLLGGEVLEEDSQDNEGDENKADAEQKEDGEADSEAKGDDEKDSPEEFSKFEIPEGVEVDEARLEQFTAMAKEMKLSQGDAQKFVSMYADAVSQFGQAQQKQWTDTVKSWRDAAVKDEEFGGKSFQQNLGHAKTALDEFASPGLRDVLEETGLGNHPELIRMLVKIGKAAADDSFVFGKSQDDGPKDPAKILYPNMK